MEIGFYQEILGQTTAKHATAQAEELQALLFKLLKYSFKQNNKGLA